MSFATQLAQDFSGTVAEYGELVRVKYYQATFSGADYDNHYLSASGTSVWSYAMHFPIDGGYGGEDYKALQQGKVQTDDLKIFMIPDANLSGTHVKIGLGSPVRAEYAVLEAGVMPYSIQGTEVYKKAYIRLLNNGSFIGEY